MNGPLRTNATEQAGVVVAYDVETGAYKTIYGMGRHNHENSVAVPGYHKPVVLSGDDTFTSGPLTGVFPGASWPEREPSPLASRC